MRLRRYVTQICAMRLCVYIPDMIPPVRHVTLAQSNACCIVLMHAACVHECVNGCVDDYGCMDVWVYACVKMYPFLYMLLSVLVYTDAVGVVQKREPHHDFLQHGFFRDATSRIFQQLGLLQNDSAILYSSSGGNQKWLQYKKHGHIMTHRTVLVYLGKTNDLYRAQDLFCTGNFTQDL